MLDRNQKILFWSAFFISIVCFYTFLDSYALNDNNEGLYAGIPLWMVQTGNYILPRLNGLIYIIWKNYGKRVVFYRDRKKD